KATTYSIGPFTITIISSGDLSASFSGDLSDLVSDFDAGDASLVVLTGGSDGNLTGDIFKAAQASGTASGSASGGTGGTGSTSGSGGTGTGSIGGSTSTGTGTGSTGTGSTGTGSIGGTGAIGGST